MSKASIPLSIPDVSLFTSGLRRQLKARGDSPSHLELMNMLAKVAGFRNHQHLRAAHAAAARLAIERPAETLDYRLVERTLNHFDRAGSLIRWPSRRRVQELCLWHLWASFPAATAHDEREVTALLERAHSFGDPALLRRELCDFGLLTRDRRGSDYRRRERRPPAEARDLIRRLRERRGRIPDPRT